MTNIKTRMTHYLNKLKTKQKKTALYLATILFLTTGSINASSALEDDTTSYEMNVVPSICVSYDFEEPCTMELEITWESSISADVCLREEEEQEEDPTEEPYIYCWQNSNMGSIDLAYEDINDTVYQLVDESSAGILVFTEVKVINRDLRNSRRRRRHVWSIL